MAVTLYGAVWGCYRYPLRGFAEQGIGSGWVSLVFNAVAILPLLPWLWRRRAFGSFRGQALTGLLIGSAFSLYTVSLVLTDVLHAILLFYLTPVWSTLAANESRFQEQSSPQNDSVKLGHALALLFSPGI